MSLDPSQFNLPLPAGASQSVMGRSRLSATFAVIGTVFVTVLVSQPELLNSGRWIPFLVGVLIFALLVNRTTPTAGRPLLSGGLLMAQAAVALALIPLSDRYFLTPLLTFVTVSQSQFRLPRRWANVFDLALLMGIATVFGLTGSWSGALQSGLGYAAGYLFVIAFTRLAQRERTARESLEQAHRQLSEYAAQVERLATARERNRLARDVHDSLGHYLTVINVQLEIVTKLMDADPARAREAAARAKELASEGLAEVRRSVAALRPSSLDDLPLPQAIRHLADDARGAGLVVLFEQTGSAHPLSPQIEIVLYRTAQESLTNIRRHAHASAVEMRLTYDSEAVCLRIHDNGVGRQSAQDHVGLSGLHERVTALSGSLRAENHPEGGFVVEVRLPYGD
jgi:signal transduction histidine kinase